MFSTPPPCMALQPSSRIPVSENYGPQVLRRILPFEGGQAHGLELSIWKSSWNESPWGRGSIPTFYHGIQRNKKHRFESLRRTPLFFVPQWTTRIRVMEFMCPWQKICRFFSVPLLIFFNSYSLAPCHLSLSLSLCLTLSLSRLP